MFKNILFSFLVAAVLAACSPSSDNANTSSGSGAESVFDRIKRTNKVRCGYVPWPPFWEIDANTGQSKGLTKELSDKFFGLAGWEPEYIQVAAGSEVQDLGMGKIDMMCGAGPWYIGTLKEVNYTRPYYYGAVYLWGREDEARFTSLKDVNNPEAHFVGMDGDLSVDLVQRLFPKAKMQTLAGITDPAQMLLNVATRKADLVIVDAISVATYNANNDAKLKILVPQPIAVYGGGFSIKKGEPELLEMMNGLMDMMNNMNIPEQLITEHGLDKVGLLPPAKSYR